MGAEAAGIPVRGEELPGLPVAGAAALVAPLHRVQRPIHRCCPPWCHRYRDRVPVLPGSASPPPPQRRGRPSVPRLWGCRNRPAARRTPGGRSRRCPTPFARASPARSGAAAVGCAGPGSGGAGAGASAWSWAKQQEVVPVEAELRQAGVHQSVPAPADGQAGDAGGPGADGVMGDLAPLVAAGEGHALNPLDEVGNVSGGCLSREAQMALRAVCGPTMERNQRPPVSGSRAKASAVAE